MASAFADRALAPATALRLGASAAERGSAAHGYRVSDALLRGPLARANLADAVHFFCTVHGRHPGVVDHAAARAVHPAADAWIAAARQAFADERTLLARLSVDVGPIPGTPGAASAEAVLVSQRHALATLARSERAGCAMGAAMALILDWHEVRPVLDAAARHFGIEPRPLRLGGGDAVLALSEVLGALPALERAMLFGAEQLFLQHHGLWDLLEARHLARLNR